MKPFFKKKYNPNRSIVFKHLLFWICVFLYFILSINVSDFEAGYILNLPSALEGESNLKTTGTFMFSVAYLLGL